MAKRLRRATEHDRELIGRPLFIDEEGHLCERTLEEEEALVNEVIRRACEALRPPPRVTSH